jgi:hypothetical protein
MFFVPEAYLIYALIISLCVLNCPLQGPLERMGPENRAFLGPESITRATGRGGPLCALKRATSEIHVHKITYVSVFYMTLGLDDFDEGESITRAIRMSCNGFSHSVQCTHCSSENIQYNILKHFLHG